MEDTEDKIYNLIKNKELKAKFILINKTEIKLLENNFITIKGISYHQFYNYYGSNENLLKEYQNIKFDGDIYLLGDGPIYSFEINKLPKDSNIHVENKFNSLKYLKKYSDEINFYQYKKNNDELDYEENKIFIEILKNNYMTSLFYCHYNTGIVGIEGYKYFEKYFYKYLDTIDNIYVINNKCLSSNYFLEWLSNSEYKDKVKHLNLHVNKLYKTNPELIAYYRLKLDDHNNFIDVYDFPYKSFNTITDQILLGSDAYRYINYYKVTSKVVNKEYEKWFPEDEITHIINVSNEDLKQNELLDNIVYDYYPINEAEKDIEKTKIQLLEAVERLNELINDKNNKIYVHCALGVNRSPSVILLYFIKYCNMTLYEAYKLISKKRKIFTSIQLFDIIYEEAKKNNLNQISPLKLRTNYAFCFGDQSAYFFALYDTIYLEKLFNK